MNFNYFMVKEVKSYRLNSDAQTYMVVLHVLLIYCSRSNSV